MSKLRVLHQIQILIFFRTLSFFQFATKNLPALFQVAKILMMISRVNKLTRGLFSEILSVSFYCGWSGYTIVPCAKLQLSSHILVDGVILFFTSLNKVSNCHQIFFICYTFLFRYQLHKTFLHQLVPYPFHKFTVLSKKNFDGCGSASKNKFWTINDRSSQKKKEVEWVPSIVPYRNYKRSRMCFQTVVPLYI